MKNYTTPFAEIFGFSCSDVQTQPTDLFSASSEPSQIGYSSDGSASELSFSRLK